MNFKSNVLETHDIYYAALEQNTHQFSSWLAVKSQNYSRPKMAFNYTKCRDRFVLSRYAALVVFVYFWEQSSDR